MTQASLQSNLDAEFAAVTELWSPRVVAMANGQYVKVAKVKGEFAYSSDMWLDDMLWGATLRSPHPRARIVGIDITEAIKLPGVQAVLTCDDVPGLNRYGLEIHDQPSAHLYRQKGRDCLMTFI